MAQKERGLGPVKRFGVRYGRTTKHKMAEIEKVQRRPQTCPYCQKEKAYRLSLGVFTCQSCKSTFTGKAYSVQFESTATIEEVPEQIVEEEGEE